MARAPLDHGFFGRRHGKSLRIVPAAALQRGLERYGLDLTGPAPAGLASLFERPVSAVFIEIGFGGGEHLLSEARRHPDIGFIGVEPFVNGMAKAMTDLDTGPLGNLRVNDQDAVRLLDWLPPASVSRLELLYPDPWPKKRHWKRRFVSPVNLDRIARVLKPGSRFHFASDAPDYVNWTLRECARHPVFAWVAGSATDWRTPYDGWTSTRYEAKALQAGRQPAYLRFERG